MTIADMKKLYPEVRENGNYAYAYSVFNECVELYKKSRLSDNMVYVGDFDNITDCVRYIDTLRNIYMKE